MVSLLFEYHITYNLWITYNHTCSHYTPRTTKLLGGILVPLRHSVGSSRIPSSLCSAYSSAWTHFIYTSHQANSGGVSHVKFRAKLQNLSSSSSSYKLALSKHWHIKNRNEYFIFICWPTETLCVYIFATAQMCFYHDSLLECFVRNVKIQCIYTM